MRIGSKIGGSLGLSLVLVVAMGVAFFITSQRMIEANAQVDLTVHVLRHLEAMLSSLKDAEAAQRGYILTGKEEYLEPYQQAIADYPHALSLAVEHVQDDPEQVQKLNRIGQLAQARMERLQETIRIRKEEGLQAATRRVETGEGKRLMDALHKLVGEMEDHETVTLDIRQRAMADSVQAMNWTLMIGTPLLVLVMLGITIFLTRHIARPLADITRLAQSISKGDLPMSLATTKRRDEVGQLQQSFSQMSTWLSQIARAADRLAKGDYTTTITPVSETDQLGRALATMLRSLLDSSEALRKSEARIRAVFENLAEGVVLLDPDGVVVEVNRTVEEMLGRTLQDLMDPALDPRWRSVRVDGTIFPVDQQPGIVALRTGRPVRDVEMGLPAADGTLKWISVNALPVRGDSGQVVGAVVSFSDITARKAAEEAMKESERRLRLAQQAARIGTFDWDIPSGINTWTADMEAMYGLAPGQFGKTETSWEQLVHPEDRQGAIALVERAFETGDPTEGEWRSQWPDGSVHWISGRFQVLKDAGGTPVRMLGVNIDITDRKAAEEALRELNETLERRIAERTEELARSNQDLEQFAYVASHDLQEPLRMITGFLELLEQRYRSQLDEQATEYIGFSVDGAQRMNQLLQDLLAFSRVGTRGTAQEIINMQIPLDNALANLRMSIEESRARITSDPMPVVFADHSQMGQLLQNLIGNALKFRRSDVPPEIHVGARREQGHWLLWVEDNGIGIDAADQDRVFQMFQRLHTREKYPGTGLGLAICKKIVERHGGRMWVESSPSRGSTFYFTLPAGPASAEQSTNR